MGITCSKECQITVNLPIPVTAYWKLDEAAPSVPRNDSVGIAHLLPGGVTEAGSPALINLGMRYDAAVGGAGYQTFPGFASLRHIAGDSLSFFGWVRLISTGPAFAFGGPQMQYNVAGGTRFILLAVGSSLDPQPWRVETFNDVAYETLTLGDWHFFFLFYDAGLSQWGYSFDNGPQTLLPTAQFVGTSAVGTLFVNNGWAGGPGGDVIFDEIGIVPTAKLSVAQIAYLMNGGAGRTYPF